VISEGCVARALKAGTMVGTAMAAPASSSTLGDK
jgi:hypothetical protein